MNAISPSDSEPAPQVQALEVALSDPSFWYLPQAFAIAGSNLKNYEYSVFIPWNFSSKLWTQSKIPEGSAGGSG